MIVCKCWNPTNAAQTSRNKTINKINMVCPLGTQSCFCGFNGLQLGSLWVIYINKSRDLRHKHPSPHIRGSLSIAPPATIHPPIRPQSFLHLTNLYNLYNIVRLFYGTDFCRNDWLWTFWKMPPMRGRDVEVRPHLPKYQDTPNTTPNCTTAPAQTLFPDSVPKDVVRRTTDLWAYSTGSPAILCIPPQEHKALLYCESTYWSPRRPAGEASSIVNRKSRLALSLIEGREHPSDT